MARKIGVPSNAPASVPVAPAAAAPSAAPANDLMGMILNSAEELGISPSDIPNLLAGDPNALREMGKRLFQVNPDFRAHMLQLQAENASAEAPKEIPNVTSASAPSRAASPQAAGAVEAPSMDIKAATSAVFSRLSAAIRRYLGPDYSMNIQIHGDRVAMQVVQTVRKGRKSFQHPITEPTASPPATSGATAVSLISGVSRMLREVEADRQAFEQVEDGEEEEYEDEDEDTQEDDDDYEDDYEDDEE